MWYQKARRVTAQALNVGPATPPDPDPDKDDEIENTPDFVPPLSEPLPPPEEPSSPEAPPSLAPQNIVDGPVDLPAGVPMPVDEPLVDESKPHEGCHCEIKTLPSGKKIWRANKNACPDCLAKEQAFNADQNRLYPD